MDGRAGRSEEANRFAMDGNRRYRASASMVLDGENGDDPAG
jgi:hypothetical protein